MKLPSEAEMIARFMEPDGLHVMASLARAFLPDEPGARAIMLLDRLKIQAQLADAMADREEPPPGPERLIHRRAVREAGRRVTRAARACRYAPLRVGDDELSRLVSSMGRSFMRAAWRELPL